MLSGLVTRCAVLEPLGGDTGVDQYQTLPVTGPEQHDWSYKTIYSLWFPLLGLAVWG